MDESAREREHEISLLDLFVVVAEHWKTIFVVPLLVGALAYWILGMTSPASYMSQSLVRMTVEDAALLQSARVLDKPMRESDWLQSHGGSLSTARNSLIDALDARPVEGADFYRVNITHRSPEHAQQLLNLILEELVAQSRPVGARRASLELALQIQEEGLSELTTSLSRLNRFIDPSSASNSEATSGVNEAGQSIVALVSNIETRRREIAETTQRLEGTVLVDDIIQPPTLADSAQPRGRLIRVLLVVMMTGVAMLILAFVRAGLKQASHTPEGMEKVNRIRRAFWLPNKKVTHV